MTTNERVRDTDALMWNIEVDPILRSTILVVGLLDQAPDHGRLRATLAGASAILPRFEQRVVGRGGRAETWEPATPDLDFHIRRVRAPGAGGFREVLDLAAPLATEAFDPARPLWEVVVVEGVDGDKAAIIVRLHHSVTDGVGGVALAGLLFDGKRDPSSTIADVTPAQDAPPQGPPVPGIRLAQGVLHAAGAAAREGWHFATDPLGASRDAVETMRSVGHLLAPATTPCSPLLVERGLSRHLLVFERPINEIHDAAHAAGATVNEAFLAAVVHGLASYHQVHDCLLERLRITMPISIRDPDDPLGGNHFVPARFEIGAEGTIEELLSRASDSVRAARNEPGLGLTDVLAAALRRLPPEGASKVLGGMLTGVDVDLVDVPGLDRPAYLAGAAIDRLYAFAPPSGASMSVTLLSHVGSACIGLQTDRAAIADPEALAACIEAGLDAVMASAG